MGPTVVHGVAGDEVELIFADGYFAQSARQAKIQDKLRQYIACALTGFAHSRCNNGLPVSIHRLIPGERRGQHHAGGVAMGHITAST